MNELVTNAVRHGFSTAGAGRVTVELKRVGGDVALRVCDNGRGLPEGFAPAKSKGLGMRVAARAASHLGGKLSVLPDTRGAAFEVRFQPGS